MILLSMTMAAGDYDRCIVGFYRSSEQAKLQKISYVERYTSKLLD